jgi:transposase, IS6 family
MHRFRKQLFRTLQHVARVIVTDTLRSYGAAKREVLPDVERRQSCYLNNRVENSHQRPVRPGLGFGRLQTAERTLAGYEAMTMIRKRPVRDIGGADMQAQAAFVACHFTVAA